jgi:hypothetical protein
VRVFVIEVRWRRVEVEIEERAVRVIVIEVR